MLEGVSDAVLYSMKLTVVQHISSRWLYTAIRAYETGYIYKGILILCSH